MSMWDPAAFVKESIMCMDNVVFVYGEWVFSKFKCYMVNVYVPQEENKKRELWLSIQLFMNNNPRNYIIFGDFNVVRAPNEKMGCCFSKRDVAAFNSFISDNGLIDTIMESREMGRSLAS